MEASVGNRQSLRQLYRCKFINGKYGWDETKAIRRVNEQLKKLRPDLDLNHIWDPTYTWYQKYLLEKSIVKNGFKITVDVRLNEKGELTIAPFVEGDLNGPKKTPLEFLS